MDARKHATGLWEGGTVSIFRFNRCPCCGSKPGRDPGSDHALNRWNVRCLAIMLLGCVIVAVGATLRFVWDIECGPQVSLAGLFVMQTVLFLRIPVRGGNKQE